MRMRLAWQLAHLRLRLARWSLMWPVNNERHRSKCRRICRKQPDLAPHQTPRYACLLVEDQWRQDITCSHNKNRDRQRRHRTSAPSDSLVLVNYGSVFTYLFTSSCLHAVTSAESLTTFRRLLKTHLFGKSFPDYLLDINWLSPVDLAVVPLLKPPTYFWLIRLIFIWFIHEVTVEGRDDCSCCWSLELCVCSASSTVLSKIYHDVDGDTDADVQCCLWRFEILLTLQHEVDLTLMILIAVIFFLNLNNAFLINYIQRLTNITLKHYSVNSIICHNGPHAKNYCSVTFYKTCIIAASQLLPLLAFELQSCFS